MIANSAVPAVTTCRICGREGVATVDVFGDEGRQRQLLNKIRYCFSKQVGNWRDGGNRAINSTQNLCEILLEELWTARDSPSQ